MSSDAFDIVVRWWKDFEASKISQIFGALGLLIVIISLALFTIGKSFPFSDYAFGLGCFLAFLPFLSAIRKKINFNKSWMSILALAIFAGGYYLGGLHEWSSIQNERCDEFGLPRDLFKIDGLDEMGLGTVPLTGTKGLVPEVVTDLSVRLIHPQKQGLPRTLTSLKLIQGEFGDLNFLEHLEDLQSLTLDGNKSLTSIAAVKELRSLVSLSIYLAEPCNLKVIEACTDLTHLTISLSLLPPNAEVVLPDLTKFPKLKFLELRGTSYPAVELHEDAIKTVEEIHLEDNKGLLKIPYLDEFEVLKTLKLIGNGISEIPISSAMVKASLSTLEIRDNPLEVTEDANVVYETIKALKLSKLYIEGDLFRVPVTEQSIKVHGDFLRAMIDGDLKGLEMTDCNWITDLSTVNELELDELKLSGNVNLESYDFPEDSSIEILHILNDQKILKNLGPLKKLKNLKELYLSRNGSLASIEGIHEFEKLVKFHLICGSSNSVVGASPTMLDGVAEIGAIQKLEELLLDGDVSIDFLGGNPHLQTLTIQNNPFSKFPLIQGKSRESLQNLTVSYCTDLTDIGHLAQLEKLKKVELSNTGVESIDALRDLKLLEELNIQNSKVKSVGQLKNLKKLFLSHGTERKFSAQGIMGKFLRPWAANHGPGESKKNTSLTVNSSTPH